ncbi:MAG: hypothetical protein HYY42_01120, partial [Chloroflexi bacterium]|nr:hypothetical protein [Chloroflexota bacterium]
MTPLIVASRNGATALPEAMRIPVLARDGTYASATNRAGREFAVMTAGTDEPLIRPR